MDECCTGGSGRGLIGVQAWHLHEVGLKKETLKPSVRMAGVPGEIRMRANQFSVPRLKNPVVEQHEAVRTSLAFDVADISRPICGFH
jgi:hypothetical protein